MKSAAVFALLAASASAFAPTPAAVSSSNSGRYHDLVFTDSQRTSIEPTQVRTE